MPPVCLVPLLLPHRRPLHQVAIPGLIAQALRALLLPAESLFLVSVKGISCIRVISDFHSKRLDLVTIIFDLSKVTVPEE